MFNRYKKTNKIIAELPSDKRFSNIEVLDQEEVYNRLLDVIAKVCQLERVNTFSDEWVK